MLNEKNNYSNLWSLFTMDCECSYNSRNNDIQVKKIDSIFIRASAHILCDHTTGFILPDNQDVTIDSYPGFWVVNIGTPKRLNTLPDDAKAYDKIRNDLLRNNHLLAYCDSTSVAFVTDKRDLLTPLQHFLKHFKNAVYSTRGIKLSF